jgi:hypothetical protein
VGARLLWSHRSHGRFLGPEVFGEDSPAREAMRKPLIWPQRGLALIEPVARRTDNTAAVLDLETGTVLARRDALGEARRVLRPTWSERWLYVSYLGDRLIVEAWNPRRLWTEETWEARDPMEQVPLSEDPPSPSASGVIFLPGQFPTAWRLGSSGELVLLWRGLEDARYPLAPTDLSSEWDDFLDERYLAHSHCRGFGTQLRPWQVTLKYRRRARLIDPDGPLLPPPWQRGGAIWFQPLRGSELLAFRDGQLARWSPSSDHWEIASLPELFNCGAATPGVDPTGRYLVTGCSHAEAPGFLAIWDHHDLDEPRAWIPVDPDLSLSVLGTPEDGPPAESLDPGLAAASRLVAEALLADEEGESMRLNMDQARVVPEFAWHNAQAARGDDWLLAQAPPWERAHRWVIAPEGRAVATWDIERSGSFGLLVQSPFGGLWAWEVSPPPGGAGGSPGSWITSP